MDAILDTGGIDARLKQTFDFSHLADLFHSLVATIQKQEHAIASLVTETEALRRAHEDTYDRTKALEDVVSQPPPVDMITEVVKGMIEKELSKSVEKEPVPAMEVEVHLPYDDSTLRIDFDTKIRDVSLELHNRIDAVDLLSQQVTGLQTALVNQESVNIELQRRLDELDARVAGFSDKQKPEQEGEFRYTVAKNPRRGWSSLMNLVDATKKTVREGTTLDEYMGAGIKRLSNSPEAVPISKDMTEEVEESGALSRRTTPANPPLEEDEENEDEDGVVEISQSEAHALLSAARDVLDIVENSLDQTFDKVLTANFGRKTPQKTNRSESASSTATPRVREYDANGDLILFPEERREYLKDIVMENLKNNMDIASIIMNTSKKAVTPPPAATEPDNRRSSAMNANLSLQQRMQNLENSINSLAVHFSEFKDKMKNIVPDNDSFGARTELAQLFEAVSAHEAMLSKLDNKTDDALGIRHDLLRMADGDGGPVANPDDRIGELREQFRKFIGVAVDQDLKKKEIVTWRQCREMILSAIVDERVRLTVNAVDAPTVHRLLAEGIGAAEERIKKEADAQIGGFKVETNIYMNRNIDEMSHLIREIDLRVTEELAKANGSLDQMSGFVKNLDIELSSVLRPLLDSQAEKLQNLPTLSKADLDKEVRRIERYTKQEKEEQLAKIQKMVDELHLLGTELHSRPREEQVERMMRSVEKELKWAVGHDVTQMKEVVGRVIGAVKAKVGKQDVVKMISER
jgi:uncharacterized protein YaaR (DUF327 family)